MKAKIKRMKALEKELSKILKKLEKHPELDGSTCAVMDALNQMSEDIANLEAKE